MKQTKIYNNLHEDTLKNIKLKRGEKVQYKLLGILPDPKNAGRFLIPTSVNVPPTDRVWDEAKQEFVDVAAIRTIAAEGAVHYHDLFFTRATGGTIQLEGGNVNTDEIYGYLELSNYNASNPHRDASYTAIYERVDNKKKAEEKRKNRNEKREALNYIYDLKDEEILDLVSAMGKDESLDISESRDMLEAYAEADPKEFLAFVNNKQNQMKALVKRALDKGIIVFDKPASRFFWQSNNETICTVPRSAGSEHISGFVDHIVTAANGDKVLASLKKLLDAKSK